MPITYGPSGPGKIADWMVKKPSAVFRNTLGPPSPVLTTMATSPRRLRSYNELTNVISVPSDVKSPRFTMLVQAPLSQQSRRVFPALVAKTAQNRLFDARNWPIDVTVSPSNLQVPTRQTLFQAPSLYR